MLRQVEDPTRGKAGASTRAARVCLVLHVLAWQGLAVRDMAATPDDVMEELLDFEHYTKKADC